MRSAVEDLFAGLEFTIAGGEEGHIINTSSGDGGVSPLPYQSVYASSKAAVSCITECLGAQLQSEGTQLGASIFYPSGGLLDTGIWTTDRNRPSDLAREKPYDPVPTVQDFKVAAEAAGMTLEVQDLDELARYCLDGVREGRFIIMIGLAMVMKIVIMGVMVMVIVVVISTVDMFTTMLILISCTCLTICIGTAYTDKNEQNRYNRFKR